MRLCYRTWAGVCNEAAADRPGYPGSSRGLTHRGWVGIILTQRRDVARLGPLPTVLQPKGSRDLVYASVSC